MCVCFFIAPWQLGVFYGDAVALDSLDASSPAINTIRGLRERDYPG